MKEKSDEQLLHLSLSLSRKEMEGKRRRVKCEGELVKYRSDESERRKGRKGCDEEERREEKEGRRFPCLCLPSPITMFPLVPVTCPGSHCIETGLGWLPKLPRSPPALRIISSAVCEKDFFHLFHLFLCSVNDSRTHTINRHFLTCDHRPKVLTNNFLGMCHRSSWNTGSFE